MNINVKGIVSNVERNADKLATLFGYYTTMKQADPNVTLSELITKPLENIMAGRFPDLEKIKWRLFKSSYASPTFKNGLLLLIGGEIAKGIVPSKWTSLAQKAGQGLATGAVIASLGLGGSPAGDPHSSGSYSSGNSPSWGYNS